MTGRAVVPLAHAISEAAFQSTVIELAQLAGWTVMHVRASKGKRDEWVTSTSVPGWVDLVLWRPGQILFRELKSEKGKTTPEQDAVLASLTAAGCDAGVWRPSDWDDVERLLTARAPR